MKTLEEVNNIHLYDFGIYLEIEPDEEEKAMLEQNIQMALQQQSITLPDAVDIREIKNLKLANKLLKLKEEQKRLNDQQQQEKMVQIQANAQAETAERTAAAEVQKQQAIAETTLQIEQGKSQFDIQKIQTQGEIQKQLAELQFGYDQQLKQMEIGAMQSKEAEIEDRKDKRTQMQATQQSQMIQQRQKDTLPTNFEIPK